LGASGLKEYAFSIDALDLRRITNVSISSLKRAAPYP